MQCGLSTSTVALQSPPIVRRITPSVYATSYSTVPHYPIHGATAPGCLFRTLAHVRSERSSQKEDQFRHGTQAYRDVTSLRLGVGHGENFDYSPPCTQAKPFGAAGA